MGGPIRTVDGAQVVAVDAKVVGMGWGWGVGARGMGRIKLDAGRVSIVVPRAPKVTACTKHDLLRTDVEC